MGQHSFRFVVAGPIRSGNGQATRHSSTPALQRDLNDDLLIQIIRAMHEDAVAGRPLGPMYAEAMGAAALRRMAYLQSRLRPREYTHAPAMQKAAEYIQDNFRDELALVSVANAVDFPGDLYSFIRSFKKAHGDTASVHHREPLAGSTQPDRQRAMRRHESCACLWLCDSQPFLGHVSQAMGHFAVGTQAVPHPRYARGRESIHRPLIVRAIVSTSSGNSLTAVVPARLRRLIEIAWVICTLRTCPTRIRMTWACQM